MTKIASIFIQPRFISLHGFRFTLFKLSKSPVSEVGISVFLKLEVDLRPFNNSLESTKRVFFNSLSFIIECYAIVSII